MWQLRNFKKPPKYKYQDFIEASGQTKQNNRRPTKYLICKPLKSYFYFLFKKLLFTERCLLIWFGGSIFTKFQAIIRGGCQKSPLAVPLTKTASGG